MRGLGLCRAWLIASLVISTCVAQDEVPSVESFIRRGSSRASAIGDYIYFEGGEIAQDGYNDFRASNQVNSTLSIDLSVSWTPEDIKIREISKPDDTIAMTKQSIFTDESAGVFYTWGGHTSWFTEIGDPVLMRFKPDGKGGGSWTKDNPSDTFENAERVESGAYASTSNGGFVFGGLSGPNTSKEPRGNVAGFVYFNFTTKEWKSDSSAPYSSDGSLFGATATFVPNFGPNGVIVILGGMTEYNSVDSKYLGFRTLYFLDPVTSDWFSQATTGEAPSGRHYHCAAGVASTNGTFEIFVFGGSNTKSNSDYSDVYTLTLPGFRWSRVSGLNNEPRAEHVCIVVGNRQFLSWGGNNGNSKDTRWGGKDTFPQGIGIFDMTALKWSNEYDASAEAYDSPSSIKSWYDDGGLDSVDWSSDKVRQMFVVKKEETGNNSNNSTGSEGNENGNGNHGGNGNPAGNDGSNQKESSKTPVAAIAGGVVGGVVALLCLAFGIWFFRRRQQRTVIIPQDCEPKPPPPMMYDPAYVSELPANNHPAELRGDPIPSELGAYERREDM